MIHLVLVMAAWLLTVVLPGVEVKPQFSSATPGDLLTWSITATPAEWSTLDVAHTPRLKVTSPNGTVMYRPLYLARGHLEVRHVARQTGTYRWKLIDPAGTHVGEGEFNVSVGTNPPGPLGINALNRRFLAWADGTPFLPVGPNVAWVDGDPVQGFTKSFATMRANGCNHVRIWMATWSLGLEGEHPDDYRLDRAEQLDGVLAAARAAGIRVTLVLDNHHDVLLGKPFPYGGNQIERQDSFFSVPVSPAWARRLRYCLARWSADDALLAFELINEADLALPVRERVIPWVNAAVSMLKDFDLDHRLHTVSWCGSDWPRALASSAIDVVQLHSYVLEWIEETDAVKLPTRDGVAMLIPAAMAANAPAPSGDIRPWLLGEVGYQGTTAENLGNDSDPKGLLLRQQLWAGFLLGGCGGGMNWWWDVYLDAHQLWPVYRSFAALTADLDLRDSDLMPLSPNVTGAVRVIGWASPRQALLWPQVRSDTWYQAIVAKAPRTGLGIAQPIRLGGFLTNRTYTLISADPISGARAVPVTMTADGEGKLSLSLPAGTIDVVWLLSLTLESK